MRRIFSAIFLVSALFVWMPQVSAQEVYAVTEKTYGGEIIDHYVVTDSIKSSNNAFVVGVHAVGQNCEKNNYWTVPFAYINGKWNFVPGGQLAVAMPIDRIDDPMLRSVIYGIFKTAREYM